MKKITGYAYFLVCNYNLLRKGWMMHVALNAFFNS